ncbi:MAG: cyclic lactone autoinducer peptide [Clostridia bacterium]|nr:cyclic lactone autoinducer peptide [Clostridia bacterium]
MKKIKEISLKTAANILLKTAKKEADSACMLFAYQPPMPDELKNRKNIK